MYLSTRKSAFCSFLPKVVADFTKMIVRYALRASPPFPGICRLEQYVLRYSNSPRAMNAPGTVIFCDIHRCHTIAICCTFCCTWPFGWGGVVYDF